MHETEGYDTPAQLPFWVRWVITMLVCIVGLLAIGALLVLLVWLVMSYPIHLAVAFGVLVFLCWTAALADEWL